VEELVDPPIMLGLQRLQLLVELTYLQPKHIINET